LAIAALAYVVSFEAIRAFAVETAAFPPELAWSAPLLVDSFTTAASLVILWRYLRGDAWRDPWYAWTLVGCATAVSVALNVAHAPERLSAQLFAALPPVALLGALELLMSVARTGLPHTSRITLPTPPASVAPDAALHRSASGNGHRTPTTLTLAMAQDRTSGADQDPADARQQVRALVAHERSGGPRSPPPRSSRSPAAAAAPTSCCAPAPSKGERPWTCASSTAPARLRPPLQPARRPGPQAPTRVTA
jgi:Protein of unknown function (DUF2637)